MLLLTIKGKEATFAVVSMAADAQTGKRDMEGFVTTPIPTHTSQKHNSLNRKSPKRILKECYKDVGVSLSVIDGF